MFSWLTRDAVEGNPLKTKYRAIDGLRGIAAILVILFHVKWSNHLTDNNLVGNGYLAVDLFFILSGFVIAANYLDRIARWTDFGTFILTRFFRLYPVHVATLTTLVAIEIIKLVAIRDLGIAPGGQPPFSGTNSVSGLIANVLLFQGFQFNGELTWNGPSWSISCEFFIYWVFALAAWAGLHRKRSFSFLIGALALLSYGTLAVSFNTLDLTSWGPVRCLSGFFLGMLIPKILSRVASSKYYTDAWVQVFAVSATVLAIGAMSGPAVVLSVPLMFLSVVLLTSDRGPVARFLQSKPLQFLGRISYSVYMLHGVYLVCILMALRRASIDNQSINSVEERLSILINPWVGDFIILAMVGAIIATAALSFVLIEEPGRRLGRRIVARNILFKPAVSTV
jgi:peptidoglycan/LPS O-acetylase OafA/YrhL